MRRDEVSPRARALVEALRDVIKNEEAWQIAESYLAMERADTLEKLNTWVKHPLPL